MEWNDQQLGRRLKLRDLNILLTVARCGSMGKAAAELSVAQPAISRTIADMEHTLGVRLLDRSPQGVEPTIYARALLDRGIIAFDELRQAIKHMEFLANPTAGDLRIGSSIALATGFGRVLIDQLSRQYPGITFHLLAAETGMTYRALAERKVDLVVARIFAPVEDHMHAQALYDEEEIVVAGTRNPWTRRRKVALADLINEAWTLPPPDSLTGAIVIEAFRAHGLDLPRTTIFTSSVPARTSLLESGRFLTIVPSSVLAFAATNLRLKRLPVALSTTRRPVGIVTLKNRTLSPLAQLLIDHAEELARATAKKLAAWSGSGAASGGRSSLPRSPG
jgi:DNA-binding transcriptional LysR family regulator